MKYSYYNPTQIEFGKDQIKSISKFISKEQKVLIVYGGGSIKKNGVYKQLQQHKLEDIQRKYHILP